MLKLKLLHSGHLMQRADSLEKTLMLGKTEGGRKRGQQRVRWLDSIIDSIDMSVKKLREMVKDRESWHAAVHGVAKSWTRCSDWTTKENKVHFLHCFSILFWKDNFFLVLNIKTTFHFSTCQSQIIIFRNEWGGKTHETNVMKITKLLFLHPLLYLGDRSTGMTLKYFNSCFRAYSCKELKLVKKKFHFLS